MKLKYVVVYEQTPNNFCAYAPDLPGCISTGKTWDEVREMMREAIGVPFRGDAGRWRIRPRTANVP